jgi:hypothetical protein
MIEIPIPSYHCFLNSSPSDDYSTNFSVGCQSLDAVMVMQRLQSRSVGTNQVLSGNGYHIQNGMRFDGTNAAKAQNSGWFFEINGAQLPNHRVNQYMTPHYQKLAFGIQGASHGSLSGTKLAREDGVATGWVSNDTATLWATQYIPVIRLNHNSGDKRLLSGVDARANPVQVVFNHSSDGSAASLDVVVCCLCTSTLMVGAGQQISFSA